WIGWAVGVDLSRERLRLLVRREGQDRPAERPVPGEGCLADRGAPARDRVLYGLGVDARAVAPEEGRGIVEPMELGERLADHTERLVEALLALLQLHPEAHELVRLVAAS